jgi:hypothetical protein
LAQKKVARTIYIKDEQMEALKRLLEKYSEQLKFEFKEYFKG